MKTILVVDDEKNIRMLYQKELIEEGYQVECAEDGDEALTIFENIHPDAVILDLRMPKRNGLEALKKMMEQNKSTPVIINTAYSNYRENFMTWAAAAYVVKSSDLTELKEKIIELVGK